MATESASTCGHRPCPECGLPDGGHPHLRHHSAALIAIALAVVSLSITLTFERSGSSVQRLTLPDPGLTLLDPGITVDYLHRCGNGTANAAPLRAALLPIVNRSHRFYNFPPLRGDPLVALASPPRASIDRISSTGWPSPWLTQRLRTGYEDVVVRSGAFLDGSHSRGDDGWGVWKSNWPYGVSKWSIDEGVTYRTQHVDFQSLAVYGCAVALLALGLVLAVRRQRVNRSILLTLALAGCFAASSSTRTDTRTRYYHPWNLPQLKITDLHREDVKAMLSDDRRIRGLSQALANCLGPDAKPSWLVFVDCSTVAHVDFDQRHWSCWLGRIALEHECTAVGDALAGEWRPGTRLSLAGTHVRFTEESVGRSRDILIDLGRVASLGVLVLVIWGLLALGRRVLQAVIVRQRARSSRCLHCGYILT
jgi:hypothetical protein